MQGLGGFRPRMTPEPNREQRCDAGQALVGIRGLFRFSSGSSRTVMHPALARGGAHAWLHIMQEQQAAGGESSVSTAVHSAQQQAARCALTHDDARHA